ncbi:MFS monosaccharide transporter [Gloeophyllum trabeum ATCC 11539]|uniref:MFS monosaccharide transporter n=1 Tax=Gloeophyllum trabeum (strain ATCC 11539 / FP-39264 / Madison 617) TaxID=670483 RepID=S7PR67_GLOTA|nr:MFS monosaccharide transporter [Gloeophyllum trabeum ATCC 11539]EPQ50331.1 MFS monosaccharide transporter [Gloeophyllum trabeum ATCC 11539]
MSSLKTTTLTDAYGPSGLRGVAHAGNLYVVLCVCFAAMGGLLFGYDQGVISVTLVMDQFLSRFPRIDENASSSASFFKGLMTAMIELGAMIGAAVSGYTSDKFSRKYAIVIGVCWFIVGSALQTGSVGYGMLVVGRLIGGVGIGTLSMVAPLYMSEVSPPNIRGALLVLEEWNIVFGIVVAYWITYGTRYIHSEWAWRFPFILQILPGLFLAAGAFFLPFSPRWLASKGRDEECLASLAKLRQLPADDPRIQQEFLDIRAEVAFQKEMVDIKHPQLAGKRGFKADVDREVALWSDLLRSGCYKRTLVGTGLMFFQQFVGINALIYYSSSLFETLGLGYNTRLTMGGIMNVCQLVGVTPSFLLLDRVGRRSLLLWGSVGMTICHIIVAVLVGIYTGKWEDNRDKGWVGVAFIFVYMVVFGLTWGPVPWAMPAEIFPSSLRAKGVAISVVSNWFNNFIIGLITPPLVQHTGKGAFIFFAVFSAVSWAFVYFFVPETRRRTLEEMDAVFGDHTGADDQARREAIANRIKETRSDEVSFDTK